MPEPTYKLCPRCGEPIETETLDAHFLACDGSIPARGEPIGNVREYLDRELPDHHESVYDRAEALADRHLRYDGSERGRR